jgi:hypothetical protein
MNWTYENDVLIVSLSLTTVVVLGVLLYLALGLLNTLLAHRLWGWCVSENETWENGAQVLAWPVLALFVVPSLLGRVVVWLLEGDDLDPDDLDIEDDLPSLEDD